MKVMKYSALGFLSGGLVLAGVLAAESAPAPAPTTISYFDSETIANGPRPDGAVYTFIDSSDPSVAEIAQFGYKTIDRVGGMLVSEVTRELATKEPSLAVSIMHLKRLELPKPVPGQPTVTAIKRTSLLIRNPANRPDGADEAALNKIHKQLMADQTVDKMLVQKIEMPGKPVEWRVYRPIASSQSCLACHGDPKTFRPGVKEALDQQYPEDKAVDYAAQEWRGIIRVSIAPATAAAKK
jgi:hypothetical protein